MKSNDDPAIDSDSPKPPRQPLRRKGILDLSERQQATVSAAITILAGFVIVVATAAIFWVLGSFLARFANVFLPLAVAAVAALVFRPYYEWLEEKGKLSPTLATVVIFLSAILPLTALAWFFGGLVVEQVVELVDRAPETWQRLWDRATVRWPWLGSLLSGPWAQEIEAAVQEHGTEVWKGIRVVGSTLFDAGAGVLQAVVALLGWLVVPVYFAFFLRAEPKGFENLEAALPFLKPSTREDVIYLIREFVNIIVAFFRGQLIIAFLQGLLFAIGFSIVGLSYGFVIGLTLGFLNIVPYLGNIIGLGVAIPLALFQPDGGFARLLAVLVVFVLVQMVEGYLLTPKIMGDRTGLHPMVIIVAIFFWGSALSGILGMILAIPLTAFLVVFWRLAREKYVRELV